MGRPERPIDPAAGPVQAFGAELRTLREGAGRPKYAVLAQRTGRSRTTLSEAAGGQQFPTWETVEAFVRACNGDVAQWRARWLEAAAAIRGASPEPEPAAIVPAEPGRRNRVRIIAGAAAAVVAGAALVVVAWQMAGLSNPSRSEGSSASVNRAAPATQPNPSPVASATDGADPKDSRCAYGSDVSTLDSAELDQDGQPRGLVELRYAPACGMAWPRFSPFPEAGIRPGTAIHVVVRRAGDNRRVSYQAPSVGAPVYGGMLRSTAHCVVAMAWLGSDPTPTRTKCFRGSALDATAH